MKHEMTRWKCFVQTYLLFVTIYCLMWSFSVTFKHAGALQCVIGYATSPYLVMEALSFYHYHGWKRDWT